MPINYSYHFCFIVLPLTNGTAQVKTERHSEIMSRVIRTFPLEQTGPSGSTWFRVCPWAGTALGSCTGHAFFLSLCPFARSAWSHSFPLQQQGSSPTAASSILPGVICRGAGPFRASLAAKHSSKGSKKPQLQLLLHLYLWRNILPPYSSILRTDRAVAIRWLSTLGSPGSLGSRDAPQKQEDRAERCYVDGHADCAPARGIPQLVGISVGFTTLYSNQCHRAAANVGQK